MEIKYIAIFTLLLLALFIIGAGCGETPTGTGGSQGQQQEPPAQAAWHKVTTFSGANDKTTDTFSIQGDKFKIKYNAEAENEYSLLTIIIYREGSNVMTDSIMADNNLNDESIVYEGKANFYLDIGAANLKSWSIEVEDYY